MCVCAPVCACAPVCVCVCVPVCCFTQDFDQLLEAMKSTLAEDSHSAFVFNCSNGKGRTTTAMVIAALTVWHFNVRLHFSLSGTSLLDYTSHCLALHCKTTLLTVWHFTVRVYTGIPTYIPGIVPFHFYLLCNKHIEDVTRTVKPVLKQPCSSTVGLFLP